MDYSRPQNILHVKPSGELYIPDPETEGKPMGDISPRVPILPGVSTLEDWEEVQEEIESQKEEQSTPSPAQVPNSNTNADDRAWLPDFSDTMSEDHQKEPQFQQTIKRVPTLAEFFGSGVIEEQPLDLDTGSSDQVVFTDQYKKPGSGFRFPGQSTLDISSASSPLRPQREISKNSNKRRPTGAVKVENVDPNYSVVIGLTYDDAGPDQVDLDYDQDFPEVSGHSRGTGHGTTSKPFGKKELYDICIKEVPKHLHRELCGYIRDGKIPPRRESAQSLQPRPSKLIQGPPALSGQFVQTGFESYEVITPAAQTNYDPFAGIPTELPKQINKSPMVITSNSKVKIYKPFEEKPKTRTTTTFTTTTATTTTTTPTTTLLTIAPRSEERRRPLLFNKRDPGTGETRASQPFEYFSRLSQYFGNRVPSQNSQNSPNNHRNRRLPPPPRLQRHRIRSSPPGLT